MIPLQKDYSILYISMYNIRNDVLKNTQLLKKTTLTLYQVCFLFWPPLEYFRCTNLMYKYCTFSADPLDPFCDPLWILGPKFENRWNVT